MSEVETGESATGIADAAKGTSGACVTRRTWVAIRVTLAALGTVQLMNGAWALLWPTSFYEQFPFGRGWVEVLPAFNEHLVRDVGALYLTTAALLLGAAWVMSRAVIVVACVSWLAFAIPHAIFHAFNLGPYEAGDAIANMLVVVSTVVLPVWVLIALVRRP